MTEPVQNGIDVLWDTIRVRVKQMTYAPIAREIGIACEDLVAFSENRFDAFG